MKVFNIKEVKRCKHIKLRLVKYDDAGFIISLRSNKNLNSFVIRYFSTICVSYKRKKKERFKKRGKGV